MSKLHLVFGGRVTDPRGLDFEDLSSIDLVGIFPDFASAESGMAMMHQDMGFYTAPNVRGTYHVVATSAADATKSGTATITVQSGGAAGIVN